MGDHILTRALAALVSLLLLWGCMADYITSTDQSEIESVQVEDDADAGLPAIGAHAGSGPHVAMDPEDPASPGWTRHTFDVLEHPDRTEWAYQIRDDLEERLTGTAPESMIALIQSRAPLCADWTCLPTATLVEHWTATSTAAGDVSVWVGKNGKELAQTEADKRFQSDGSKLASDGLNDCVSMSAVDSAFRVLHEGGSVYLAFRRNTTDNNRSTIIRTGPTSARPGVQGLCYDSRFRLAISNETSESVLAYSTYGAVEPGATAQDYIISFGCEPGVGWWVRTFGERLMDGPLLAALSSGLDSASALAASLDAVATHSLDGAFYSIAVYSDTEFRQDIVDCLVAKHQLSRPWTFARLGQQVTESMLLAHGYPASAAGNINGPTVIEIPTWIAAEDRADPSATHYMYFAGHDGTWICMAWATSAGGPWTVHDNVGQNGVLEMDGSDEIVLDGTLRMAGHIASPEVYVDAASEKILLAPHSPILGALVGDDAAQRTVMFTSDDGLSFSALNTYCVPGPAYMRFFEVGGTLFAFANSGELYVEPGGDPWAQGVDTWDRVANAGQPFAYQGGSLITNGASSQENIPRHTSVHLDGDTLWVWWSNITAGGANGGIEHLRYAAIDTGGSDDPTTWTLSSGPHDLAYPTADYEGAANDEYPHDGSIAGAQVGVRQLRDPYYHAGYLYYAYAGEEGIAVLRLEETKP